jgi:hypothetical protein
VAHREALTVDTREPIKKRRQIAGVVEIRALRAGR